MGFDREGYGRAGFNKEGFNKKGYDREGYNKKGFNVNGLNRDNIDKQGHRKGNKTWEDVVKEYISKEGDMLWRIEEAEYSDSSKWEKAQQKKDIRELVHIVFNNIINNVVSVEYRKNSRFRTFIKNKIYEVLYDRLDSIYYNS